MTARDIAECAAAASERLVAASTAQKDKALLCLAEKLARHTQDILSANAADLRRAKENGLHQDLVRRLRFGEDKIQGRIRSLRKIAALPDPVGQPFHAERCANGLVATRVRVPIGVILMIYEARPHVTINAGAFCLKSGNAAILRGGSEAQHCNQLLGELWRAALNAADLPDMAVQVISGNHQDVHRLLQRDDLIDLVIPRGGKGLIRTVTEKSRVPVLKHFEGICHVYLDESAPVERGLDIALDSKCLMPEVCNAMETLLVHHGLGKHLPQIIDAFRAQGVLVKGCPLTRQYVGDVESATEEDWRTEYLDNVVSIGVVTDVKGAIQHINAFGSHHTDAIVTDSEKAARDFVKRVDSGVVLVNASTMFCDGESLGMGAEIGISTDKLHARGPMGLEELTSYKHVIRGAGHIMGESRLTRKADGAGQ
ncbi:MAG TPA: glutamate-5-semialdehyde dehydrogenase [Candidatus Hydrogenedentes bacterium]|nr:glutamate-5-semialdehyde dehydrogenase [Candidatus Hydrogenedentota bacterium]